MNKPHDDDLYDRAVSNLKTSAIDLIHSVTDKVSEVDASAISDIELATSIWKQADRLQKEASGDK